MGWRGQTDRKDPTVKLGDPWCGNRNEAQEGKNVGGHKSICMLVPRGQTDSLAFLQEAWLLTPRKATPVFKSRQGLGEWPHGSALA